LNFNYFFSREEKRQYQQHIKNVSRLTVSENEKTKIKIDFLIELLEKKLEFEIKDRKVALHNLESNQLIQLIQMRRNLNFWLYNESTAKIIKLENIILFLKNKQNSQ